MCIRDRLQHVKAFIDRHRVINGAVPEAA